MVAQQALVHLFGREVAALTDALEQLEHPLTLGGEPLAAIVQARAQAFAVDCRAGRRAHR